MNKTLTSIVLGLSLGLDGCTSMLYPLDLRQEYPTQISLSGKVVDVDEERFVSPVSANYSQDFEVLRVLTKESVKKVLIPHLTSYKVGDNFLGTCHEVVSGRVPFISLIRSTFMRGADASLAPGQIATDYILLEDMYAKDR